MSTRTSVTLIKIKSLAKQANAFPTIFTFIPLNFPKVVDVSDTAPAKTVFRYMYPSWAAITQQIIDRLHTRSPNGTLVYTMPLLLSCKNAQNSSEVATICFVSPFLLWYTASLHTSIVMPIYRIPVVTVCCVLEDNLTDWSVRWWEILTTTKKWRFLCQKPAWHSTYVFCGM